MRSTFENCRKMRSILYQNLIVFEERDVYLNSEFRDEILDRCSSFKLPSLFVNGKYFGVSVDFFFLFYQNQLEIVLKF